MKKLLLLGAFALAITGTSAIAQNGSVGGTPSTVSGGGPGPMNNSNPSASTGPIDGPGIERPARGTTTGMSPQDRATVPGSLTAGGTSQGSPNTAAPGASRQGY